MYKFILNIFKCTIFLLTKSIFHKKYSNEIELTSILHDNNNNQLTNTTLQRSNDDIVVNNVSFNPILNKDNIHEYIIYNT